MKTIITEGQISIFDLPKEIIQPKETATKPVPRASNFDKIINQYKDSCNRIFIIEKKLYVEIGDQTLSYEADGEPGGIFIRDMLLRPKDEILVANEYKSITAEQIKTVKNKMHVDKFIKRKSDNNILIQYDNFCMAIYPNGHFAKWKSPAVFKDNEVFRIDEIESINKLNEEVVQDPIPDVELHLGDRVSFNYDGMQIGKIARIYNNGETVNVSWNNRQTAFYYKSVVKINA